MKISLEQLNSMCRKNICQPRMLQTAKQYSKRRREQNGKLGSSKLSFVCRNITQTRSCLNQLCRSSGKQRFTEIKREKAIFKMIGKFGSILFAFAPLRPWCGGGLGLEQVAVWFPVPPSPSN